MSVRIVLIASVIASLVFILDLATPLGVAGGVPHLALILCGWWFHERSAVFFLAVVGTILTILGYFLSPEAGVDWIVLLNRGYALFALWATSIFVWWTWRDRRNGDSETAREESLEPKKGIHRLGKEGVFVLALIAVIIASSWGILSRIENGVKADIAKSIETILEKSHAAIRHRYAAEKHMATVWANDMRIKAFTERLLELSRHPATLKNSAVQNDVRKLLLPVIKASGLRGYFIIDKEYTNLASSRDNNIGLKNLLGKQSNFLARVWAGETNISLPLPSEVPLENDAGQLLTDVSTMFAAAPIRDTKGNVIAIFTFRMDPVVVFSSVFLQSQTGESGETYLFDKTGLLISESRFNETLTRIGMLKQDGRSNLHVHLHDPGVDLTLGHKPTLPLDQQPLTLMARSATQGKSGANLDGYRDYRGVPVVGTWHWDEELKIGIASEVDVQEAFSTYHDMRFFVLFSSGLSVALLITLGVGSFLSKQNLWAAKQQADFANNAKSDLLANMSHELRTPLNAVIGFSSVMKSQVFGPMNSKYLDYAKDINSAGGHLLELINDIPCLSG